MNPEQLESTEPKIPPLILYTKERIELPQPWLLRYEPDVPRNYVPSDNTLPNMLKQTVENYPEQVALIFMGAKTTYRELWQQAKHFAAVLQKSGVKKGDRVAVMLPNCPQYVISYYGILLAGGIVVNTSPLYVADELLHQLKDCEADTLIILDSLYPRFDEIQDEVGVKRVLVTGIQDALPFPLNMIYPIKARLDKTWVNVKRSPKVRFWKDIFETTPLTPEHTEVGPEDIALLQYTGGTTGTPKGAMLSHRNLIANCEQCCNWMGGINEAEEVVMGAIPFFHVYGMTVAMNMSIYIGCTTILIPNPRDIPTLLKQLAQYRVTIFPGVPTLYNAIANFADVGSYDLSSIKICLSGSAPLMHQTVVNFSQVAPSANLVEGYGLTEASPCTHVNPLMINQREGIGLPLCGVDAIVVDKEGNIMPVDARGELWISAPNVMKGYWRKPEETAKALVPGYGRTWLRTGDVAVMDAEGYFQIVDRQKDLIISGGFNVYPREIEEVLNTHPAVLESAAYGTPNADRGEDARAVVVLRENSEVSAEQLLLYCRKHMSPYKIPKSIEFRSEIPKSSVLKILRRQLRDEWYAQNREAAELAKKQFAERKEKEQREQAGG